MAGYFPALVGTPTRNDRGIGGEHIYVPRFNHRPGRRARLPPRVRHPVLEYGREHLRRPSGFEADPRVRRGAQERDQAPSSRVVRDPSVRRGDSRTRTTGSRSIPSRVDQVRRAAPEDRLSNRRQRAEDDRAHGRHGRGDREGLRRCAGELPARTARRDGLGDPRARHLPDGERIRNGRRSTASTRCTRSRTCFVVDGSAFPNASEKNPTLTILALVVAGDRSSGGGDQAWLAVDRRTASTRAAPPAPRAAWVDSLSALARSARPFAGCAGSDCRTGLEATRAHRAAERDDHRPDRAHHPGDRDARREGGDE